MINYINEDWEFTDHFDVEFKAGEREGTKVRIPHTVKETPFNYFDSGIYQMVAGYRKRIKIPSEWKGKRIFVKFMAVAHMATVYVNGNELMTHKGGYTAFEVEITAWVKYGEDNDLLVRVDSNENLNIPPFGFVVDYMTYGGIYRDVILEVREKNFIKDIFIRADHNGKISCTIARDIPLGEVALTVTDAKGKVIFKGRGGQTELVAGMTDEYEVWDLEHPVLYKATATLTQDGVKLDEQSVSFGFRKAEFKADGFYLNDKKIKLIGLNRHQSYPYAGYAMPDSMQKYDAEILKNELGVNMVRTSHYPQAQSFVDRCDELGLLVFTEIPGWQHVGDDEWKDVALKNVQEMVEQYRNHPSVVLWGVRINESQDDDDFYRKTNELARRLDDSRATTGVRFLEKSSLLEDVYAHNDFSHVGNNEGLKPKKRVTPDMGKAYMVSECNGHMYPTKSFDDEEHRLSHALRHAAVIESMEASDDIAGVLGWCMFDYNTHKDFGSGDNICYHGVMDMFRNPKAAAYLYQSQADAPLSFEVISSMDIGEHPAGQVGDVYIFTNADYVKVYKNDVFIGDFYPDRKKYSHMPHPPVIVNDFIGTQLEDKEHMGHGKAKCLKDVLLAVQKYGQDKLPLKYKLKLVKLMLFHHMKMQDGVDMYFKYVGNWGGMAPEYKFVGIRDGKEFAARIKKPGGSIRFETKVSSNVLCEDRTYDVAQVRVRAIDVYGNLMPYYMEPFECEVKGPIEVIGPKIMTLKGGMGGCYVRTTGKGAAELILHPHEGEDIKINFEVK